MMSNQKTKSEIFIEDLKISVFPLTFIIIYEIFHIKCYKIMNSCSPIHYYYFEGAIAIFSFIAGIISDKFLRKNILAILIPIGILEFTFLYMGWYKIAIWTSPIFVATTVARASLVYNHAHRSVKNMMSISYIFVFIPWSYFQKIYSGTFDFLIIPLFVFLIISFLFFKDKKKINHDKLRIQKTKTEPISPLLLLSLLLAQFCFFLIIESTESFHLGTKLFELIGKGSLLAAILSLVFKGNHKQGVIASFMFLFLLSFTALLSYEYWGNVQGISYLGHLAVMGGFYLPIITEQFVKILGKNKKGTAVGLIELIIGAGSLMSIFSLFIIRKITLTFFVVPFVVFIAALIALIFYLISLNKNLKNNYTK